MRWSLPVTLLVGALATTAVGVGGVVAVRAGEALPGTTVAGLDVGGLGPADIGAKLSGTSDARTGGTLVVLDDERRFPLQRADLGVQVDLDRTAEGALSAGRGGSVLDSVLGPLLGRGEPTELIVAVDDAAVQRAVDGVAEQLDVETSPGGITVEGTTVTASPPVTGRTLQREEAAQELDEALVAGRTDPLPLPVEEITPSATPEQVEQVAAMAREALSAPYRLVGAEQVLAVSPGQLAPLLSSQPEDGGGLRLAVDRPGLEQVVMAGANRIDRAPAEASFTFPDPQPVVETQGDLTWSPQPASVGINPSTPGLAVDVTAATDTLTSLIGTAEHERPLPAGEVAPELSTEQAQQAGVGNVIGTFTTRYTAGQPRAANIARIAEILDGTYIAPGDQLSINGIVGPRTTAKGFLADGAIIDGELVDVVGGGVSQFATTLFNAAFFAGLDIEEHQPHSFYISRYPAGRESTVNFDSIDVAVRNDTANGLVLRATTTAASVTVSLYGDNGGRSVTSTSGPRQPRPDGGFRIEVTRNTTGGDGTGGTRVFRTSYNPPPED